MSTSPEPYGSIESQKLFLRKMNTFLSKYTPAIPEIRKAALIEIIEMMLEANMISINGGMDTVRKIANKEFKDITEKFGLDKGA